MRLTLAAILAFGVGVGAQAQVYTIATNPQGSLYYTAASGIVKVAHDKLDLQLRVQPMAGTSTALPMLNRGEVEFSFANVDEAEVGYRGTEEFAGKPNSACTFCACAVPGVVMGFSSFMVTHDKVPEELVYKFTKMLHESRADIVAIVPLMQRFDPAKMSERHVVPYHPGAIKFYSEVAQWPPKQ